MKKTRKNIISSAGLKLIIFYQRFVSPFLKPSCMFFPSCSEYTKQAIEKYGMVRGIYMGGRRILRCHPWQSNKIDPVP